MRAVSVCMILVIVTAHTSLARVFTPCQLLSELRRQRVPENELATWICIAQRESGLNTAALSRANSDGSRDNGIFQINNRYWCRDNGRGGGCNLNCAALRNNDITDDIRCAQHIKRVQGFGAWTTYRAYCTNSVRPRC
uniref:lysozyme n=1 Tax=Reticulitermes speratus TaxID=60591 RepID=A0A1V1FIX5_9NEOP